MKRYQELLRLVSEDKYVTTTHLADQLGISSRTVRSDIAQLNDELGSWGARIVATPRRGVILTVSDRARFEQYRPEADESDFDQDERVRQTAEYLLTVDHPVLLDDLADMLFFSRSTLKRDMREVRRIFGEFDLRIDNRAHQGMKVEGKESDIRRCLAHITRSSDSVGGGDGRETAADFKEIIARQITQRHFRMSDLAIENLAIHLLIAVRRVRIGNCVELPADVTEELADEGRAGGEMDVAMAILGEVEELCHMRFPRGESYNFLMHLVSKEIVSFDSDVANTVVTEQSYQLVMRMLERVRDSYQIDLRHDLDLVTMLSMHLIPLRMRMKYRMVSVNPLLDDIRRNYVLAYSMATVACSVLVEEYGSEVPADEVAYVAMYLSIALARRRDKNKDNVLIVCGSGKASSEMLAYQVREAFGKDLNVVGTSSAYGLSQIDFTGIDYVFTTVRIDQPVPVPIIEVSALLGGSDVNRISQVLSKSHMDRLVTSMIQPELVFWKDCGTKAEVISFLCSEVMRYSNLPDDFESLVFEREKVGMTSFGNMVAIAHPLKAVGDENICALAILKDPIDWDGDQVQLVFLLTIGRGKTRALQSFYRVMNRLISNRKFAEMLIRTTSFEDVEEALRLVAETDASKP